MFAAAVPAGHPADGRCLSEPVKRSANCATLAKNKMPHNGLRDA
jgi:hypothetical protein